MKAFEEKYSDLVGSLANQLTSCFAKQNETLKSCFELQSTTLLENLPHIITEQFKAALQKQGPPEEEGAADEDCMASGTVQDILFDNDDRYDEEYLNEFLNSGESEEE